MKELQSLDDVYNKRIFRIPDYQRGYAWGEKQLSEYWEDIINLKNDRFHYTGVLSIKNVPSDKLGSWKEETWLLEKRKYKAFHVVDGQQRLTTTSILLQCIVEAIELNEENHGKQDDEIYLGSYSLKDIKARFLYVYEPPHKIIKSYKFGYESDNPSFEYLRYKIFNESSPGTIEETFYTLNLQNAKNFFKENLDLIINESGFSVLEEIYVKVTQRLMFNLYELQDDFDVFVAFETMNNRGKKLSDLELLKNRLIYLTTLYEDHEVSESNREKVRYNINDAWKEVYHQLGRNKKNPLNDDDFLRAHWIMYFKYSRKKGNDYINFLLGEAFSPNNVLAKVQVKTDRLQKIEELREHFEEEEEIFDEDSDSNGQVPKLSITEINDYVLSLKSSAVHWYNAFNPNDNNQLEEEERNILDKLNRIGTGYFRPLVMSLFVTKGVDPKERLGLLKNIERFIFLIFRLSRANATYRNSSYFNFARELYEGKVTISEILEKLEEDMIWAFSENGEYISTSFREFISRKFKSGGTGFYGWNGIRYILYEYEEELKKVRNQPRISWPNFVKSQKDKVSIEHIYPQTADKQCWTQEFSSFTDVERIYLNGSLGNLLPLSSSINSSLQNDCFADKKDVKKNNKGIVLRNGYKNGSYSEQEVALVDNWGPEEIKNRGLNLLSFMEKRWRINLGSQENKLQLLHLDFID